AHLERSIGSSLSRRASPSKLNPSTLIKIQKPDKSEIQGFTDRNVSIPERIMDPHSGVGGVTPRLRKLSAADSRMAAPNPKDERTSKGDVMFGKMWRVTIR